MSLRFAANVSMLWPELEPLDRIAAAAEAGFKAVEMQYPQGLDAGRLRRALRQARMELVLFNLHAGDREAGERGLLSLPGREQEFDETVRDGLVLAKWLGTRLVNVPAGNLPEGVSAAAARIVAERNLRRAVSRASGDGVTMLVEPLNRVDRPGYALVSFPEAARLIRAVGSPFLRLQFDIYHAGINGDPLAAIRRAWPLIGHVQLADHPGRHQPGTGRLPIAAVLAELERRGYQGVVGLEYVPLGETVHSLAWMSSLATRAAVQESTPVQ